MIRNVILILSLVFSISAFVMTAYQSSSKTVYIDMIKVYEGFKLSKELNKDLDEIVKARRHVSDSLYRNLRTKTQLAIQKNKQTEAEISELKMLEEEYLHKQKEFEEENRNTSVGYNEKIWNQINQYVMEFGKAKGYNFILGANGQGNIMYGDQEKNLTAELTNYINERYDGKVD